MRTLAALEVLVVAGGIVLYIWRWQFVYPNFAVLLLLFIIATFFVHGDRLSELGLGSQGLVSGAKVLIGPTSVLIAFLFIVALMTGELRSPGLVVTKLAGLGRYFAFCLLQQFGLQSFFTNRLLTVFRKPNAAAWGSAAIFAIFHIPNPVLIPATLLGGYVLSRIFINHRSLIPLAIAQAIVGSLLSVALPAPWHHGLRVGPGYYRWH